MGGVRNTIGQTPIWSGKAYLTCNITNYYRKSLIFFRDFVENEAQLLPQKSGYQNMLATTLAPASQRVSGPSTAEYRVRDFHPTVRFFIVGVGEEESIEATRMSAPLYSRAVVGDIVHIDHSHIVDFLESFTEQFGIYDLGKVMI